MKKVIGTQKEVKRFEQNDFDVFLRYNIERIEEISEEGKVLFKGWGYDEVKMSKQEYQSLISETIQELKEEDLNNKLAIVELFETFLI